MYEIRSSLYERLDNLTEQCKFYLNRLEAKKLSEVKIYNSLINGSSLQNVEFFNEKLKKYLADFNNLFSKITFEASESSFCDDIVGKIESDLIIGENIKHRTFKTVPLQEAKQATSMCTVDDLYIWLVDKRENKIIKYNNEFKVCEQITNIQGMKLNKPSLICTDEIENVYICNLNNTQIIVTDLNIKEIKFVLGASIFDDVKFIKDIKVHNGLLYVLEMTTPIIQVVDADKNVRKISLRKDHQNESLSNPVAMSVHNDLIAVIDYWAKIYIFDLEGTLIEELSFENIGFIKSLCLTDNYLFLHAADGAFICYKIEDDENNFNKKNFTSCFTREISALRETSESMVYFNKKVTILLPYAKSFIIF